MINRIMANVDVKLGIKHILERVEQAYSRRSPVRKYNFSWNLHFRFTEMSSAVQCIDDVVVVGIFW